MFSLLLTIQYVCVLVFVKWKNIFTIVETIRSMLIHHCIYIFFFLLEVAIVQYYFKKCQKSIECNNHCISHLNGLNAPATNIKTKKKLKSLGLMQRPCKYSGENSWINIFSDWWHLIWTTKTGDAFVRKAGEIQMKTMPKWILIDLKIFQTEIMENPLKMA